MPKKKKTKSHNWIRKSINLLNLSNSHKSKLKKLNPNSINQIKKSQSFKNLSKINKTTEDQLKPIIRLKSLSCNKNSTKKIIHYQPSKILILMNPLYWVHFPVINKPSTFKGIIFFILDNSNNWKMKSVLWNPKIKLLKPNLMISKFKPKTNNSNIKMQSKVVPKMINSKRKKLHKFNS